MNDLDAKAAKMMLEYRANRISYNLSKGISMPGPFDGLDYLPESWEVTPDFIKEDWRRKAQTE